MLKSLLTIVIAISIANTAIGKNADTTILYFKVIGGTTASVRSLEEADFFRLVLPPDSGDNRYNIKEFYKNGKVKLIGKHYARGFNPTSGVVTFDGDCVSFYPNGKKSSVAHYKDGDKVGLEYLFYPDGKIYCCRKHQWTNSALKRPYLHWECYDASGNMICKEGAGKWIEYDNDFKNIIFEGPVLDGLKNGEWRGSTDTIKYTYQFKKGFIISSVGYDKKGNAHPFNNEFEQATYRSGPLVFLERLRNRIKLPKDASGRKISIDTMHVSFVVERDGKLSQFEISGMVNPEVKTVVFAALEKSNEWIPSKIYGMPFRTKVVLPLIEVSGWNTEYRGFESYQKEIWYKETILKD